MPSSPLQRVVTRRPTAATCWRMLRLTRSMKAVLICQPQAANTCCAASSVPNTTRWLTRTSTTVVDHMVSWFHTIPFSGGWNYGGGPGPWHVARRVDCRHRAGLEPGTDGGGATDWDMVPALGRAAAGRSVSAGLAQPRRTQKRLATG